MLNNLTVSLDWAMKMQKAGWLQGWTGVGTISSFSENPASMKSSLDGSYFKWFQHPDGSFLVSSVYSNLAMVADAPTAEEIMRELPDWIYCKVNSMAYPKWVVTWVEGHMRLPTYSLRKTIESDNLSDALASMWIYLKSNNLLT